MVAGVQVHECAPRSEAAHAHARDISMNLKLAVCLPNLDPPKLLNPCHVDY